MIDFIKDIINGHKSRQQAKKNHIGKRFRYGTDGVTKIFID